MKQYWVYILASKPNGTLYIGVTSDLIQRVYQHRNDFVPSFTQTHRVHLLVYYEEHADIYEAIRREKQIKWWKRRWKVELIQKFNPTWKDLYDRILG